ncbi:MAG: Type I restriction enzyme EcoKI M protein [Deltaproteobacteria bacterium ADurb.BinA179]|nr:MAG: Type I restriction enzyme EcoKI M protein [Deltaproteobacteria bacterium ADurb.BinA179]HOI36867.1 N-6 DNA methylase [Bacillota bacterium]
MNSQQIEKELWEAADQLRANSKLTAAEYSMPVLGLIFLRHADNRFQQFVDEIEKSIPPQVPAAQREGLLKLEFQGKAAMYLPQEARYDYLSDLPKGKNVGKAIDDAMELIENEYEVLKGALPRGYSSFEPDLLAEIVKIFNRDALKKASGDVFGRIYEYFLNKFAQSGAQEGGEFFTPPSLVRMIVNVIEPDHGIILDPAVGSAGMFVQTGHFIEDVRRENPNDKATFFGQEKSETNTKLARMNLAVHGLDGKIIQGNTFYNDEHRLLGRCDYVMANPPFNVDSVDTKKVEAQVGEGDRLPFGLPGINAKTGAISNANSLWIQYFYSFLSAAGRAGFVMASSASDAGNKDKEIRRKLVDTGHVDVMIAIGPKFFYTRSLPCTLWFFDKGKGPAPDQNKGKGAGSAPAWNDSDHVLMLDARNVYHAVSARSHIFTEEQLANLTAITWLYRGEQAKFLALVASYQRRVDEWLAVLPDRLAADSEKVQELSGLLTAFADQVDLATLNEGVPEEEQITAAQLTAFKDEVKAAWEQTKAIEQQIAALLVQAAATRKKIVAADLTAHAGQKALQAELDAFLPLLRETQKEVEARHKLWLKLQDRAEKVLSARKADAYDNKRSRELKRALTAADEKKDEEPTIRDLALEGLKQAAYFIVQVNKLHQRFPEAVYADAPGLCKVVSRADIAANDYSLTPGRYVGVAPPAEDDEEDFQERLTKIHTELEELNEKTVLLAERIRANFVELMG